NAAASTRCRLGRATRSRARGAFTAPCSAIDDQTAGRSLGGVNEGRAGSRRVGKGRGCSEQNSSDSNGTHGRSPEPKTGEDTQQKGELCALFLETVNIGER